jgi:hypothetical protein
MVGMENFAISTSCIQNRPSTFDITFRKNTHTWIDSIITAVGLAPTNTSIRQHLSAHGSYPKGILVPHALSKITKKKGQSPLLHEHWLLTSEESITHLRRDFLQQLQLLYSKHSQVLMI